jgi:hypothetical protein
MIYLKTRESYRLTKHDGIKYFRDAFLFMGLAYILRFVFALVFLYGFAFDIFIPMHFIPPIVIMFTGYFSTMGLIYLILSSTWKYTLKKHLLIFMHILAIVASAIAVITRSPMTLLLVQLLLMIMFLITTMFMAKKINKKITQTKALYLLVGLLWFINLFTTGKPLYSREIDLIFRVITLAVFTIIYFKVSKWLQ